MLLKDILKAKKEGESVDIDVKGVDLRMVSVDRQGCIWWSTDDTLRVQLRMTFDIPSAEGKPLCGNLDVPEVSLSTKPKYDPCRKLRKGDIVEPCQVKGRWHSVVWEGRSGIHFTVAEDEDEDGIVSIKDPDCKLPYIAAAVFFNLVIPVEELDPYYVCNCKDFSAYTIFKRNEENPLIHSSYYCAQGVGCNHAIMSVDEAKAAAETKCASLNEEWRKKQNNG